MDDSDRIGVVLKRRVAERGRRSLCFVWCAFQGLSRSPYRLCWWLPLLLLWLLLRNFDLPFSLYLVCLTYCLLIYLRFLCWSVLIQVSYNLPLKSDGACRIYVHFWRERKLCVYVCKTVRLGTGWSMHTSDTGSLTRSTQLTYEEQEHIMHVIRQAEHLEHTEMERVGSDTVTSLPCSTILLLHFWN